MYAHRGNISYPGCQKGCDVVLMKFFDHKSVALMRCRQGCAGHFTFLIVMFVN